MKVVQSTVEADAQNDSADIETTKASYRELVYILSLAER